MSKNATLAGNHLFSTSILTLDARTGRPVWHFQTIHHDSWDWDNPNASILADVTISGRARKTGRSLWCSTSACRTGRL